MESTEHRLRKAGIRPSAHRLAVADYVLSTQDHPSAATVFAEVAQKIPMISRATVYNTLATLVEKGLLQRLVLSEGNVVFDPRMEDHHHFIDDDTGAFFDIPASALTVTACESLKDFEIQQTHVVLRGRLSKRKREKHENSRPKTP